MKAAYNTDELQVLSLTFKEVDTLSHDFEEWFWNLVTRTLELAHVGVFISKCLQIIFRQNLLFWLK